MIRMVASLLVIGAVLWIAHRMTQSRLSGRLGRSGLDVIGRRQLTKSSSVVLVRAGERTLLLGVTDGRVDLLAEGDALAPEMLDERSSLTRSAESNADSGVDRRAAPGISVDELLAEEEFWTDPDARRRRSSARGRTSGRFRPHTRPPSAEPSTKRGARKRHGNIVEEPVTRVPVLDGAAPTRMSVIDALRERTVRRT